MTQLLNQILVPVEIFADQLVGFVIERSTLQTFAKQGYRDRKIEDSLIFHQKLNKDRNFY